VVNRFMGTWLRSGWHRPVSATMMVLTFVGVRSGRTYSFPVGYTEDGEGLVTFTRFSWWKNLREQRPVSLRLRGREVRGGGCRGKGSGGGRALRLLPKAQPPRWQVLRGEGRP